MKDEAERRQDLRDVTIANFECRPLARELPRYRIKQIFEWVARGVSSFDEMTNLPKSLRAELETRYVLDNYHVIQVQRSADGTVKALGRLLDGALVESVLMTSDHGLSVCISTQVGCKMGCTFCATAVGGFQRNLTAGEMLGQIHALGSLAPGRIDRVVLMGSGEPLDNLSQVVRFVQMATDPTNLGLSGRSITISTCGLPDAIRALADHEFAVTLAISLHNPFDDERRAIMPIARRYSIDEVLGAAKYYFERTGRRVTYEYALIAGENDSVRHAEALGRRIQGQNAHVNLIPVNPVTHRDYRSTQQAGVRRFQGILSDLGVPATVRRELGADIDAACGQLRANYIANTTTITIGGNNG